MEDLSLVVNEERFWPKVDRSGACWVWQAAILNGYGRFGVMRNGVQRSALAHRIAYRLSGRDLADDVFLDHMCRNRSCVNPDHLRPVTNKQNLENHSGPAVNNTSGVRGVSWFARTKKWRASTTHNGRSYSAGYFHSIEDAERAVVALRNSLFTHNLLDRKAV